MYVNFSLLCNSRNGLYLFIFLFLSFLSSIFLFAISCGQKYFNSLYYTDLRVTIFTSGKNKWYLLQIICKMPLKIRQLKMKIICLHYTVNKIFNKIVINKKLETAKAKLLVTGIKEFFFQSPNIHSWITMHFIMLCAYTWFKPLVARTWGKKLFLMRSRIITTNNL